MLTLTLRRWFGGKRQEAARPFRSSRSDGAPGIAGGDLIFRMKSWPQLPDSERTAEIYRMLSVMSSQPVNRRWLVEHCKLPAPQLDRLLVQLVAEGALEVIDPARFAGRDPASTFPPVRTARA
jgi:hypothetical protein